MKTKIKIKIGFFSLLMLSAIFMTSSSYLPVLILSVAIHEFGHVVIARLCGIELSELKLGIFGASIIPRRNIFSYKKEILLCLGGPAFNFLSAFLFYHLRKDPNSLFLISSLSLGILNLFPIQGFDGGRIFEAFLCLLLTPQKSEVIIKTTSFFCLFILWIISVYLLIKASASLSLFIFSASMFAKIFIPDIT